MKEKIKIFCDLVKNDFKAKYASSIFGVLWAYALPLVNLLVMWYVFQVGLRNSDMGDVPFIVWFAPASLAWSFFADTLSSVTTTLKEYDYLVKKVNFDVSILPVVKIVSGCIIHTFFIFFMCGICKIYNIHLTVYAFQLLYYFACMIVFLLGLGWLLSACMPFLNDLQSVVSIIIQIGFWMTPIVWNFDILSDSVKCLLSLNPMYYIVTGYRDSLINQVWFWEKTDITMYFWMLTVLFVIVGYKMFRKLRPQFADVL